MSYFLAKEVATFTLATRLLVATLCLMAVVFINSYTGILVSYLMAPKFLPLITTVQSLADSREITVAVSKHTSVEAALFVNTE
jgi:ionotropic glutamate receptor